MGHHNPDKVQLARVKLLRLLTKPQLDALAGVDCRPWLMNSEDLRVYLAARWDADMVEEVGGFIKRIFTQAETR